MKRMLVVICAAALLAPAAANAYTTSNDSGSAASKTNAAIAKAGQFEGTLTGNTCSAAHPFTVGKAGTVTVLVAGTNVSGELFAQVLGRDGALGAQNGTFNATAPGVYTARVCYVPAGDGTDQATISYVGMIAAP
jgi:hypothetical protein